MAYRLLLLSLLLACAAPVHAQESYFEFLEPDGLAPVEAGFLFFVDADRDGEFDLFGGGSRGTIAEPFPSAFVAVSGPEEEIVPDRGRPYWQRSFRPNPLPKQVHASSGAIADLNGDNVADFLVSGHGLEGAVCSAVLGDAATPSTLGEIWFETRGLAHGVLAGGDLNQDGRPDFLHAGITGEAGAAGEERLAELLQHEASGLSTTQLPVPGFAFGDAVWGDIDNDDDEDLLVMGERIDGTLFASAYDNAGGALAERALGITPLAFADIDLGDYDADGDLDLAVLGGALDPLGLRGRLYIYANDGGTFQQVYADWSAEMDGTVHWGDYDNDGDLDLIIGGRANSLGGAATRVLQRTATGWEQPDAVSLPAVGRSAARWGDYDADGDLDLAYTGRVSAEILEAGSQRNDSAPPNAAPDAPEGLTASVDGDVVVLTWTAASDDHTPAPGLSYNVRIGRTSAGTGIVSPLADLASGRRYVVEWGNAGQDESYTVRGLEPGTYYWSVQAIDGAYVGSPFGEEQTFTIPAP